MCAMVCLKIKGTTMVVLSSCLVGSNLGCGVHAETPQPAELSLQPTKVYFLLTVPYLTASEDTPSEAPSSHGPTLMVLPSSMLDLQDGGRKGGDTMFVSSLALKRCAHISAPPCGSDVMAPPDLGRPRMSVALCLLPKNKSIERNTENE